MRALRWHARNDLRIDDVTLPELGRNELVVEVEACGLCGTDLDEYKRGPLFVEIGSGSDKARTLGHEIAGRVVRAPPNHAHRIGELVAVSPDFSCGKCECCRDGLPVCESPISMGLTADGGLADFCVVPAASAVAISDEVGGPAASLVEPLAIALHALRALDVSEHDRLVVFGGGAVGLLAALAATALGCSSVLLVEPLAVRADLAKQLGIDTVAPGAVSPHNASAVVECSGSQSGLTAAIEACGRRARLGIVGIHARPREIDAIGIVAREITLRGVLSYDFSADFLRAANLISSGAVDPRPLVSEVIGLGEAIVDGFDRLARDPTSIVKLIVAPKLDRSSNA